MATITYSYAIDSTVYHVDEYLGVRKAIVRKITVVVTPGGGSPDVTYVVAFADARDGIVDVDEPTLFDDVDLALAYYKTTYVI